MFLLVKVMNIFRRKKEIEPQTDPEPTKEEKLLMEIRDLLAAQQAADKQAENTDVSD